jgi:hypothetical protein
MSRILICHRPADSSDFVARLAAHLRERFGAACLAPYAFTAQVLSGRPLRRPCKPAPSCW